MQSGDPFSSLSGGNPAPRASSSAEPLRFGGAAPQQQHQGGMDGVAPGGAYGAQMMRPGAPNSGPADDEARRGAMSLQASLVRLARPPRAVVALRPYRTLLPRRAWAARRASRRTSPVATLGQFACPRFAALYRRSLAALVGYDPSCSDVVAGPQERMQKKYADDMMRVLEAVTIRLERLETSQERAAEALTELKTTVGELKQSTEAAYRSVSDRASQFESTLGSAAENVQALRDKQVLVEEQQRLAESTLAEAHAELARVKDVARSVAKEVVREVQEQARQSSAPEEAAVAAEAPAAPVQAPQQVQAPQPPASPELPHAYSAPQQPPPSAYSPQAPQMAYANAPPPAQQGGYPSPGPPPFAPPPPAAPYPPMPMYAPPPPGAGMYGAPPQGMHGEMHPPPPPQMLASPPPQMDYGGYGAPPPPPPPQHGHGGGQYHYAPPPPPRGAPPTPPAQLATSKVPIEKVIDDLSAMGFTRDEVRGVIRSLTENGQARCGFALLSCNLRVLTTVPLWLRSLWN